MKTLSVRSVFSEAKGNVDLVADHEMSDLIVPPDLRSAKDTLGVDAAHRRSERAEDHAKGVIERRVLPRPADMTSDIDPAPIVGRHRGRLIKGALAAMSAAVAGAAASATIAAPVSSRYFIVASCLTGS
jgi:hypothetical protein